MYITGQTVRLYNPISHQWNIYLVNAAKDILSLPPVVGQFVDGCEEFYDQEDFNGRIIFVQHIWSNTSPVSAQMIQSFSIDGGKTWEPNRICELVREP